MDILYNTNGNPVSLYTTGGVKVFGPSQNVENGDGPVDVASLTEFRQIANNTAYFRTLDTVPSDGIAIVTEHEMRSTANGLVIQQTAIGSTNNPPTVVRRAGFVVDGTWHPALFGGKETVTITPGSMVRSDPTLESVIFHKGKIVYTVVELGSGQYGTGTLWAERSVRAIVPGGFSGAIPPMNTTKLSGGPTGLYGMTVESGRPVAIVGVGDSFMDTGWFRFGSERNGLAWSDWSVWLDTTHTSVDRLMADRMPATGPIPYDVAFVGWGGNDRSKPYDEWLRSSIASWRFFESVGCKVATKTLHPYSASTDKWTTVEGQTDSGGGVNRAPRNDWLRDGAPIDSADNPLPTGTTEAGAIRAGDDKHPLKYPVFDEADVCETSRNSGIWKVDGGAWTPDGTHLSLHGNSRMADAFAQWVADNLA